MSVVHDQVFGARTASYNTIRVLDKKVRDFYMPPSLQLPGFGGSRYIVQSTEKPSLQLTMQRHLAFAIKEISKLVRNFEV